MHQLPDLLVAQIVQAIEPTSELNIRDGFDVEDEDGHASGYGDRLVAGGLFSLHEHGYGDDQARLVRQRDVPLTDSELVAHDPTALGPDDLRSSPGIRHNARIANPHPVRESGSHRLHDGFLGCKAHGEKTHRSRALAKPLQL